MTSWPWRNSLFLYYLLQRKNARVLHTLLAELDEHLTAVDDPDAVYSYSEVQTLPYLNACLKESHRMAGVCVSRPFDRTAVQRSELHSFNMSLPRIVPEGGTVIAGEYFPAGVRRGIRVQDSGWRHRRAAARWQNTEPKDRKRADSATVAIAQGWLPRFFFWAPSGGSRPS